MTAAETDSRNITGGREIPSEGYCDQPYVVKTDDGAWLCVLTTGPGREGQTGQHVVAMRSTDRGRTWSGPVPLEPGDRRENSYAGLLKAPGGRVFCFYNHNTDDVREVPADDPPFAGGVCRRVDSLGYCVFRFSDDGGRTWSRKRYVVPIREMAIDRENPTGGASGSAGTSDDPSFTAAPRMSRSTRWAGSATDSSRDPRACFSGAKTC